MSADTIVPDPENPASYNRYSYVYNNPLKYTDPSGHCAGNESDSVGTSGRDDDCWAYLQNEFCNDGICGNRTYSEVVITSSSSVWLKSELEALHLAILDAQNALGSIGIDWQDTRWVRPDDMFPWWEAKHRQKHRNLINIIAHQYPEVFPRKKPNFS